MKTRRWDCPRDADRGRRPFGFTLVEMIVVMAILAILAAAAIPSFVRIAQMDSDRIDFTSRLVYGMLNAARVHAATFRTDTALYYTLAEVDDSRAAELPDAGLPKQIVADGIGIARRMTRQEVASLKAQDDFDAADTTFDEDRCYLVLEGPETRLQTFHPDAAVWGWVERLYNVPLTEQLLANTADTAQGVTTVLLYRGAEEDTDGDDELDTMVYQRILPRTLSEEENAKRSEPLDLAVFDGRFPAHVFKSSGEMRVGGATGRVRYAVRVGHSPASGVGRRFLDGEEFDYQDSEVNPDDDATMPDVAVPNVVVELNQMTGRVKIAGDDAAVEPPDV